MQSWMSFYYFVCPYKETCIALKTFYLLNLYNKSNVATVVVSFR